jgi:hypothetical protein
VSDTTELDSLMDKDGYIAFTEKSE